MRVIDGDTFETTEKQLIRLASVDAPELEYCGGKEAKAALEKKVLNRPIYLKVLYRDPFNRLVSQVYNNREYINGIMIKMGYADYYNRDKETAEELKKLSDEARSAKRGIHGSSCTQITNLSKPSCSIKGNSRENKIYYPPDCYRYENVGIQLFRGDQWFCSEKEAQDAGF